MANFHDQASAIWAALDNMLEQDPESYKKFIEEQLKEGQRFLKQDGLKESSGMEEAFQQLSFGQGPGAGGDSGDQKKSSTAQTQSKSFRGNERQNSETSFHAKRNGNGVTTEESTSQVDDSPCLLLDDEIGTKSIIAQIVKNATGEEEEEGDLHSLELPSAVSSTKIFKKPMIEEL